MNVLMLSLMCLVASPAEAPRDKRVRPLSELPAGVTARDGEVTLHADFEGSGEGQLDVYLVNRSGKAITLFSQDGDIMVKLEYANPQKKWVRAQAHAYSWCGNSYFNQPELKDETFIRVNGYRPKEGKKARVRYGLYQQPVRVVSNVGFGLVSLQDVKKAANDALTVRSGSLQFVRDVALGKRELKNEMDHLRDLRRWAIRELANKRFVRKEAIAILQEVIAQGDSEYASEAESTLEQIRL